MRMVMIIHVSGVSGGKDEDGNDNTRVRGIRWIDNDMVNLLSGLFSSSVAFALSLI